MPDLFGTSSRLTAVVAILFAGCLTAHAGKTRYVSPTGSHLAPYTNWARAARTIQAAARVSAPGDKIIVANGVYEITNQIVLPARVKLVSKSGPAGAIIKGNGATRCVYMPKSGAVLTGFTITGGATDGSGAGVYCNNGTVADCVITNNHASGDDPCGGGVYAINLSLVSNCVVRGNSVTGKRNDPIFSHSWGGGIYASQSAVIRCVIQNNLATAENNAQGGGLFCNSRMENCLISDNTTYGCAYAMGGGVYSDVGGSLRNCLVVRNLAYVNRGPWSDGVSARGGGVYFFSGGSLQNCTISENRADGEFAFGGGYHCGFEDAIVNSIIWGNATTARREALFPDFLPNQVVGPPTISHSLIGEDPGFEAGSYRLDGELPSPCIDAGANASWMKTAKDLAGKSRISNAKVDIGAYEFAVQKILGLSGSLAFGNVLTGQTATATLTIANTGNRALTVSGLAYPAGFSGAWSGTVPAGGSQEVTVRFRPRKAARYGGLVTVNSDKTSGKNTIAVTGTGVLPCQFCFSANAYSAREGVPRKITVKRINGSVGESSVDYVMKPITAEAWQDFSPESGTLTWANGETASRTIMTDTSADSDPEGPETFQIILKNPVGATLAAPAKTVVTILE